MEEAGLIKWLLFVGIVCLIVIAVSNMLAIDALMNLKKPIIPMILCAKQDDEYILAQPASLQTCDKITDYMSEIAKPEICNYYEGEKRAACLQLVNVVEKRKLDCVGMVFGITSASTEEVVNQSCSVFLSEI
jgi:hypothetical protein